MMLLFAYHFICVHVKGPSLVEKSHRKFKSRVKQFLLKILEDVPKDRVISRAWDGILEQ